MKIELKKKFKAISTVLFHHKKRTSMKVKNKKDV